MTAKDMQILGRLGFRTRISDRDPNAPMSNNLTVQHRPLVSNAYAVDVRDRAISPEAIEDRREPCARPVRR